VRGLDWARWNARAGVLASLTACAVLVAQGRGRAAELRLRASGDCAAAADLTAQIDTLLGRSLASIEGVDFEVALNPLARNKWALRIDTIERVPAASSTTPVASGAVPAGARRSRELVGKSCAELADAAAVAIAMTIRSAPDMSASPPAPTADAAAAPAPHSRLAAPDSDPRRVLPPPASPWTSSLDLVLVGDEGTMPSASVGVGLDVTLRHRWFGLMAGGAILASQTVRRANDTGGEFAFAWGFGLACARHDLGRLAGSACGGVELGRLAGQGVGANVVPSVKSTLWRAIRAELGGEVAIAPNVRLVLRAGATAPLARPVFRVNQLPIHQASPVAARITLGVGFSF